jgi:transposase
MPAPYSQDLRRRVIHAYYNREGSQRQLAKRFQVSLTFVRNLLRHYRQTGTIEPKKHGGGIKTKIDNHGFSVIEQMIQQKPDLIFSELCQFLKEKTGERVVMDCPRNKGKNTSILGALSLDGLIASMTVIGSTDTKVFETYVEKILLPQLWQGAIVLMDNLSVHKGKRIKELISSVGAKLVFLPAYSPDLSPIELCWSKFKDFLRSREPRTQEELDRTITEAIAQITEDDVFGWFAHCGLFI